MTDDDVDILDREPLRLLVGPTATGKTGLALEIAGELEAEIVSLDSMLVYRGMDVGTAKPSDEERARIPHHLIDLVPPSERYDVQRWLADARDAVAGIFARGRTPLFVGGTGFYLAALVRGLFEGPPVDPELRARIEERVRTDGADAVHAELTRRDPASAERLHVNDTRRVVRALEVLEQTGRTLSEWQTEWAGEAREREESARIVGLTLPTPELDRRIAARTETMLDAGWREEAVGIRSASGFGPSAVQALGYDMVLAWADGEIDRAEAARRIALRTRQFARRQRTWYRKFAIDWIEADAPDRRLRALKVLK
ncbi:MAG: tRNA (adenosine(37)-N6)-dimethylallyltransferase MiaA [bacterium]|nr:tRNA (adenosine(37)-N6)-dimethylallyltransferase MiaA [bacterium]